MTKHAHPIDVDHVLTVAQRRCDDVGVNVVFDTPSYWGTTPEGAAYTDGQTIHVPAVRQPVTQKALDRLYGYIIHECGHHLRSEAFDIARAAKPPEHLFALYNITEDDGMERATAEAWRGDATALSKMNKGLIEEVTQNWKGVLDGTIKNADYNPEAIASLCIGQLSRLEWDTHSSLAVGNLIRNLPDDCKELIDKLEDEGWVQRFRDTNSPVDTWNLAVDLAKRLYPENDQDEYEEIRQKGLEGAEKGDDAEPRDDSQSSFADKQGGSDSVQGDIQNAKSGDGNEDAGRAKCEGGSISWKDCVISEHNEWEPAHSEGGLGPDWTGYMGTNKQVGFQPIKDIHVIDYAHVDVRGVPQGGYSYYDTGWSNFMPTEMNSRAFANKIRRYIQAQARTKVSHEKHHGRLDRSAIIRLALPPIDGGEWNKKIFYDMTRQTMKDTAVFVLCDWSGSMCGDKMHFAADACQRLVHTFERILKVPVALAAFSNGQSQCDIGYLKRYGTRGLPAETLARRFSHFEQYTSSNNDADAVMWAYSEILKRKEERKLLIVLSDGQPTDAYIGHPHTTLKYITNVIEKDPRVQLHGVGICSDAVKNYYNNYKVLNSAEEINTTLFNIIKDGDNEYQRRK